MCVIEIKRITIWKGASRPRLIIAIRKNNRMENSIQRPLDNCNRMKNNMETSLEGSSNNCNKKKNMESNMESSPENCNKKKIWKVIWRVRLIIAIKRKYGK